MNQGINEIEAAYDTVAEEYAEAFSGEHDRKPKDREMLHRFSQAIGNRKPVWDIGCGPGQTAKYLKDLGVEISGLDLSEKLLKQARNTHPGIHFKKGNRQLGVLHIDATNGINLNAQVQKSLSEMKLNLNFKQSPAR